MERKVIFRIASAGALITASIFGVRSCVNNLKNKSTNTSPTQSTEMSQKLLGVVATATAQEAQSSLTQTQTSHRFEYRTDPNTGTVYLVEVDGVNECAKIRSYPETFNTVHGSSYVLTGDQREVIAPDGTVIGYFHRVSQAGAEFNLVQVNTRVCARIGQ